MIDPAASCPGAEPIDVRDYLPSGPVHGVLAAPPCTVFAGSGARWWADRHDPQLRDALSIVDACLRVIAATRPAWWALENPVGRLVRWLGPWVAAFDPWQYGDPWQKRTCLWGSFAMPAPLVRHRPAGTDQRIWRMGPSPERAALRSVTPPGFAAAFAAANP